MTEKKWWETIDKFAAAKSVLLILLFVYIGILFSMKSGSRKPFAEIADPVAQQAAHEKLIKAEDLDLKKYYGLNAKDYRGADLYLSESAMGVEEILLIKAENDEQMEAAQQAAEKRLSVQKNNFKGYGVEQTKLLEHAVLEVKGNYLFLAVSGRASELREIFLDAL